MKKITDDFFYQVAEETIASKQWQEESDNFADEMVKQYFKLHHLDEKGTVTEEQMADAQMVKTISKNVAKAVAPSIIAATFNAIARCGITNLRRADSDDETHKD